MNQDFIASAIDGYTPKSLDERTARYLDNYWIDRESLERDWAPLIESAFSRSSGKMSITEGYAVDILQGGILFTRDEFLAFVASAKGAGAKSFAVVEDMGQPRWNALQAFDFFRFSYPIDIHWDEMTHSSALAQDVFERPIRCFFVITDNGKVGKYANNDVDTPYDLVFHA